MALQQRLSLKLAQRLVMTPSLQQAIKLLQMTRLELQGVLDQEIVENPMLEDVGDQEDAEEAEDENQEAEPSMVDIDLDAYFNDYLGSESTAPSTFEAREAVSFESSVSQEPDLYDHLLWQLRLSDARPPVRDIAELVIGNLDADGFLRASIEELQLFGAQPAEVERCQAEVAVAREMVDAFPARHEGNGTVAAGPGDGETERGLDSASTPPGYPVECVDRALDLVRSFDPPGIGWHTLRECLLAQLAARDETGGLAYRIVDECWSLLTRRQFRQIARHLRAPLPSLEAPVEAIKALETRPGRLFSQERTEYVEPDVVAVKTGEEWAIQLNDDGLSKLRISRAYRTMLQRLQREEGQAEAREFLKDKMRSAMWLMKSLDQRQRTIYKVAESILRQQRGFFDHGIDELRPMVLRDVADDIGMHESTVSRVVSNKYIHTPRGLYPLKFFFHSGIDCDRGREISSLTVKRKLQDLIGDEDGRKPLSDSALTRQLQRKGINIARRTVAKYRDELGIPSSNERRQIF